MVVSGEEEGLHVVLHRTVRDVGEGSDAARHAERLKGTEDVLAGVEPRVLLGGSMGIEERLDARGVAGSPSAPAVSPCSRGLNPSGWNPNRFHSAWWARSVSIPSSNSPIIICSPGQKPWSELKSGHVTCPVLMCTSTYHEPCLSCLRAAW